MLFCYSNYVLLFTVIDLVSLQASLKNDIENFFGSEVYGYNCIIYGRILYETKNYKGVMLIYVFKYFLTRNINYEKL